MTNIIIVEDNAQFRKALWMTLNLSDQVECNYTFSSCEDAISEIKESHLEPDIILLDIGLPGISGIDGIPMFKKVLPNSKIIILTIHDDHDNIFKAICAGANGYLLKDASTDVILNSIEEVITGGAPMNIHIAQKVLDMFREQNLPGNDYGLSDREREILVLLVDGLSKNEIATRLHISPHTVDMHIRKIYTKMEVNTRSSAVAKALRENII
jgi:DNA-binding NarL/FixJ family response regulator